MTHCPKTFRIVNLNDEHPCSRQDRLHIQQLPSKTISDQYRVASAKGRTHRPMSNQDAHISVPLDQELMRPYEDGNGLNNVDRKGGNNSQISGERFGGVCCHVSDKLWESDESKK
jgi:hypothetical protein